MQDHRFATNEEPAELTGNGRRYGKDIQVKRDFKDETEGEEQNEAKAKTGDKKEDICDNGVKDCGKQQNRAKAKGGVKKEETDKIGVKDPGEQQKRAKAKDAAKKEGNGGDYYQAETGGQEQNKAKAKSGNRKDGITDNGVKNCGKCDELRCFQRLSVLYTKELFQTADGKMAESRMAMRRPALT